MKKTILLVLTVFLFSFSLISAQTLDDFTPLTIGDHLTWEHSEAEVVVILMNISLSSSDFTWGKLPYDTLGPMYSAGYQDKDGTHQYTFIIDKDSGLLRTAEYTFYPNDNSLIIPTMEKIRDNYGLKDARPYHNDQMNAITAMYDDYLMVSSNSTICGLGYKMGSDGSAGMIDLTFWDKSFYNIGVG